MSLRHLYLFAEGCAALLVVVVAVVVWGPESSTTMPEASSLEQDFVSRWARSQPQADPEVVDEPVFYDDWSSPVEPWVEDRVFEAARAVAVEAPKQEDAEPKARKEPGEGPRLAALRAATGGDSEREIVPSDERPAVLRIASVELASEPSVGPESGSNSDDGLTVSPTPAPIPIVAMFPDVMDVRGSAYLVESLVIGREGAVTECYRIALSSDRMIEGDLEIQWDLLHGSVGPVDRTSDTVEDAALTACVIAQVRGIRYPSEASGRVVLPIVFARGA